MADKSTTRKPRNWPSIEGTPDQRASKAFSRLEDVTRLIAEIAWEVDTEGHLTFVSDRVTMIFPYLPNHLIGRKFSDFGVFVSVDPGAIEPNWQSPFRDAYFEMRGGQGQTETFLVSSVPIFDRETWQFTGACGTARCITQQKQDEQRIQDEKRRAELANRAKTELLANMSHELRTPLNAIIGFSNAMAEETFGPVGHVKYVEYLKDIQHAGDHLLGVISDILDAAAIEDGKIELNVAELDLESVVEASRRLIEPRAQKANITLVNGFNSDLPRLLADQRRVKQILLNLLSNAVKFTDDGGTVSIDIELSEDGSLLLKISDTGKGMSPENLEKAMTPFGQVEFAQTKSQEGTGLGLPLTKGLIEAHGGTLSLESVVGEGTTATVSFPPERVVGGG